MEGPIEIIVPNARERSLIGLHWNAIAAFLESGRVDLLDSFARETVFDDGSGQRRHFATDPESILEHEAEVELGKSIYKKRAEAS